MTDSLSWLDELFGGPFDVGGDLTGNTEAAVVAKVNGIACTGTPAAGAVLRATSTSAAAWGPVDLADTDAVTGVLPKANQGAQDIAGDVTGNTGAAVVAKVKGTTITSAGGALAVGAVLRTTAVGTADWGPVDLADTDACTGVLPVANGGTGATTLGASKAVLYADASGNAAGSAFATVNEAGQEFDLVSNAQSTLMRFTLYAGASTNGANIIINKSRGTSTVPTKALSGDQLGGISARAYHEDGTPGFGPSNASAFRFVASEDQFAAAQGAYLSISTTLTGTNASRESLRVAPGVLSIFNQAGTFKYLVTAAAIAADRTLTLPLLAGNDTMVCEAFTQTLTNKTIAAGSNTITGLTNSNLSGTAAITGANLVAATQSLSGSLSAADKTKLDGLGLTARTTALDANHLHAWELDDASGNFADTGSSGSKVSLTASGTPLYASRGFFGPCPVFGIDATGASNSAAASVLNSAFSDLPTGAATIEIWYKSYAPGSSFGFMAGFQYSGSGCFYVSGTGSVGAISAVVSATAFKSLSSLAGLNAADMVWHHIGLTYDGASVCNLYIDGERWGQATGQTGSIVFGFGTTPTLCLARNIGGTSQFIGQLAKLRLSNIARAQSYFRDTYAKAMGSI